MELLCLCFYAILVTTLIGTTSFAIWRIFCRVIGNHIMKYRYAFLRIQLIFWLVPVGVIMNFEKYYDIGSETHRGTLVEAPLGIYHLAIWVVTIWMIGCFQKGLEVWRKEQEAYALMELNEPADEELEEMAREICKELGLKRKIYFHISPILMSAVTYRCKGTHVVIPGMNYSDEELRILLLHELLHVRKNDVLMRRLVTLVTITQWFNDLAEDYRTEFRLWGEIDCDKEVCEQGILVDDYVRFLIKQDCPEALSLSGSAFFVQKNPSVADRVEAVMKMQKMRQWKKVTALLCGVMFVALAGTNAYAAGGVVEDAREQLAKASVEESGEIKNDAKASANIEYQKPASTDGLVVHDMDSSVETYSGSYHNTWTMEPGSYYSKGLGVLTIGAEVDVMVRLEAGMEVGLSYNGIHRYFVADDGVNIHTFTTTYDGTHRIYVENTLDHTVVVEIMVMY